MTRQPFQMSSGINVFRSQVCQNVTPDQYASKAGCSTWLSTCHKPIVPSPATHHVQLFQPMPRDNCGRVVVGFQWIVLEVGGGGVSLRADSLFTCVVVFSALWCR